MNCEYGNDKKSKFKILFYLKKNAPKKNEKVAIMCRITVNGKQSAFCLERK